MSVKLGSIFKNHMVLQRNMPIPVFGTAPAGEEVRITFAGQEDFVRTDEQGNWASVLDAKEAGGPYELMASGSENKAGISDVLVGDVYIAAGQSNMEFLFENSTGADKEKEHAGQAKFRYYKVPQIEYVKDGKEYPEIEDEGWYDCTPETVGKISGVAYYFAKEVRNYTDVPIGIVGCHKGGTSASCWVNKNCLTKDPKVEKFYYTDYWSDIKNQTDEEENQAIAAYQKIYNEYQNKVQAYQKQYPERSTSQLKRDLGHTPWPGPKGKKDYGRPCGLYETVFQKILGLNYKAVLWYQGEEDSKFPEGYETLLSGLLKNWRNDLKNPEIPFFIMQLPNYNDDKSPDCWAILREAQRQVAARTKQTQLICMLGCGEEFNIHPADKSKAGRLGLMVAETFYDKSVKGHAPEIKNVEHIKDEYILKFEHTYGAIIPTKGELVTLSVSADGKVFETVDASVDDKSLKVRSTQNLEVIRYAWENNPEIQMTGATGIPVIPFSYHC